MHGQAPDARPLPFAHHGRSRDMIGLAMTNLLLNIITLSLWRFWGRTRVRRQLWNHTTLWGDPLEYTGTGRELFLGFLVILFLVFLPLSIAFSVLQALMAAGQVWAALFILPLQLGVAILVGAGLYRAYRYQMTRTRWRGIRGGLDGAAWQYGLLLLMVGIASALSFGWAAPWAQMQLASYRMDHSRLGTLRFECTPRCKGLYGRFTVSWLCAVATMAALTWLGIAIAKIGEIDDIASWGLTKLVAPILVAVAFVLLYGLAYAWYQAAFLRRLAANTELDGHAFQMNASGWALIRLTLGNALISFLSLGILRPWAALRTFRFACSHLNIDGIPDFSRIQQSQDVGPRLGEGLASVFDGAGSF